MIVRFKPSALRQTRWHEYLIRFVSRRGDDLIAGLIAARFGPVVGGLFLAFPAIFPASATLIEKQVRERKKKRACRARGAVRKLRRSMRPERHLGASGLRPSAS